VDLPLLCQCRVPGLSCIIPRLPTDRTERPYPFAMLALTEGAIWVRISCEFSAQAEVVEELAAQAAEAAVPVAAEWVAEVVELLGAGVVPVAEVRAVAPLAAAVPAAVERVVLAGEPAAEAEPPEVVVLLPAGIRVDLIAILTSITLTTSPG